MVAVDAAKFAAQTGFQRINPKTDLFKVRLTLHYWAMS
jgi:hypothetical protein